MEPRTKETHFIIAFKKITRDRTSFLGKERIYTVKNFDFWKKGEKQGISDENKIVVSVNIQVLFLYGRHLAAVDR